MYISKVEISKYKGFNEATIELVDGLNVILGHNNGGKSTLLDAIALVIDTERKKKLSAWDFYQGISLAELKENAPSIKISLYFSMSSNESNNSSDVALFSTYAVSLEPKLEACMTYVFYLPETETVSYKESVSSAKDVSEVMSIIDSKFIRKYTYAIYGGKENLHQQVSPEDIHKIDFQKVEALRNVEGDLYSGRAELLHDVLGYFLDYDIKTSDKKEEEIKTELRKKQEEFRHDTQKSIQSLIERIQDGKNKIIEYANETGALYNENDLIFDGNVTEEQLLRVLNILVSTSIGFNIPIANNGLGYNNLIYMSLLLAKMQSNKEASYMGTTNAKAFSILAIEEPEAHLHPELQYQFLDFLRRNISDHKVKQVFMTSHSPSLTAKVKLDELCCLFKNGNHNISAYYLRKIYSDEPNAKKFVQRYLDATRADMLFAGKILFVEGLAEQILIPVFVQLLGYDKEWHKQQAIIVNIGGRYFEHFLKLYDKINQGAFPIRVACLTDRDPVKKSNDPYESFSSCWPIEYGVLKDYTYDNHSEKFVAKYEKHENIHFFSQDQKGKTLEYEIARINSSNPNILTDSMSNRHELEQMMKTRTFDEAKLKCKSKKLIDLYSNNDNWNDDEKREGLIAARYLCSINKGENALELATQIADLPSEEKEKVKIPQYIKDAISWLLEK